MRWAEILRGLWRVKLRLGKERDGELFPQSRQLIVGSLPGIRFRANFTGTRGHGSSVRSGNSV